MGGKENYGTEKELRIKDIDRNGEKQSGRGKIHDKILHQSITKSVSLCRINVFATVKEAVGHFPTGLRLSSGFKDGSGIFATIHPSNLPVSAQRPIVAILAFLRSLILWYFRPSKEDRFCSIFKA